jgi:Recombination endonuclease VII
MVVDEEAEPACWSWRIPELRDPSEELRGSLEKHSLILAYDAQFDRRARRLLSGDARAVFRFVAFHDGRCAVCAEEEELVVDHDHWTGLVRGLLCGSCNSSEAGTRLGDSRVFSRYRRNPPAAILAYFESYSGTGISQIMRRVTQLESEHERRRYVRRQYRLDQLEVIARHRDELAEVSPRSAKATNRLGMMGERIEAGAVEFSEDLDRTFQDLLQVVYACLEKAEADDPLSRARELHEMIRAAQDW